MHNQDPINQIKQTLQAYEEPYHLGAWNQFIQFRKVRKMQAINRWLAAACVLMALSAFWLYEPGKMTVEPIADAGPQVIQPEQMTPIPAPLPEITRAESDDPSQTADEDVIDKPVDSVTREDLPILPDSPGETQFTTLTADSSHDQPSYRFYTESIGLNPLSTIYIPELKRFGHDSEIIDERKVTRDDLLHARSGRNLSFGLAYSSLLNVHQSSTNWNVGGGLMVKWDLNETFALSSGFNLARSRLQYDHEPVTFASVSQSDISSSAMEIDFLSLEIPLNLQYSITDRVFLSAGVSSASFLRERYRYDYQYREFMTTMEDIDGEMVLVSQMVTISKSETTSEPSLSSFELFAFYNISAGYSLGRRGENRFILTFEPFVKIPTGSFAAGNISYTTGGLQLQVSF